MFFDAHAHLDTNYYDDPHRIIKRAFDSGTCRMLAVGCGLASSEYAVELAKRYPGRVYASVGVHPHEAADMTASQFDAISKIAEYPEVVAIGETGIDYHYNNPRDAQRDVFRLFLDLASSLNKAVIVHSREAEKDTLAILEEKGPLKAAGQIHCFTGTYEFASAAVEMGMYISFSGAVTFSKSKEIRKSAGSLPPDRILIETDCPYMSPVPFRGLPNEPMFVSAIASTISGIRNTSVSDIARHSSDAAEKLFKLPEGAPSSGVIIVVGAQELLVSVHEHGESCEKLESIISSYPLKRIKRLKAFLPEGKTLHLPSLESLKTVCAMHNKKFSE